MVNYHNRYFKMLSSTTGSDNPVIFHYRQEGTIVWGTYSEGTVQMGTFLAKVDAEGHLDLRFQHVDIEGSISTGRSDSRLTVLDDGRYRIEETFELIRPDGSLYHGFSVVEEFRPQRDKL